MVPTNTTTDQTIVKMVMDRQIRFGMGWTAGHQAVMQAATLAITMLLAIFGGILTGHFGMRPILFSKIPHSPHFFSGAFLRLRFWEQMGVENVYDDKDFWCVSEEGMPTYTMPMVSEDMEECVELKHAAMQVTED